MCMFTFSFFFLKDLVASSLTFSCSIFVSAACTLGERTSSSQGMPWRYGRACDLSYVQEINILGFHQASFEQELQLLAETGSVVLHIKLSAYRFMQKCFIRLLIPCSPSHGKKDVQTPIHIRLVLITQTNTYKTGCKCQEIYKNNLNSNNIRISCVINLSVIKRKKEQVTTVKIPWALKMKL